MTVQKLEISEIEIRKGRRPIDKAIVAAIAASVQDVGLRQPVEVRRKEGGGYILISGHHRIKAFQKLGKTVIPAMVDDLDDATATIVECDENLCRADLDALQRANEIERREGAWRALNPDVEHRTKQSAGRPKDNSATVAEFEADTAAKTGNSKRTVQGARKIAAKIPQDVRALLADHPIAKSTTQLEEFGSYKPEVQRVIAEKLLADPDLRVADAAPAKRAAKSKSDESPSGETGVRQKQAKKLCEEVLAVSKTLTRAGIVNDDGTIALTMVNAVLSAGVPVMRETWKPQFIRVTKALAAITERWKP